MAKTSSSNALQYIFPVLTLIAGIVMLILYFKARAQQKKNMENGLADATGSGDGYTFLSDNQLKDLTTIKI